MAKYLIVRNNKVINVVMWDGITPFHINEDCTIHERTGTAMGNSGFDFYGGVAYDPNGLFIFNIQTDNLGDSQDNQFKIPTESTGTYTNVIVDWGDGTKEFDFNTWDDPRWIHTYAVAGNYKITIMLGVFNGFSFNNTGDKEKLVNITQFGFLGLGNSGNSFEGCSNLVNIDYGYFELGDITNLSATFKNCTSLTSILYVEYWYTYLLEDVSETFSGCTNLLISLEQWDISNITTAENMLNGVTLSVDNYNLLLVTWGAQTPKTNVTFNAGNSQYSGDVAEAARNNLINNYSWTFIDNGKLV